MRYSMCALKKSLSICSIGGMTLLSGCLTIPVGENKGGTRIDGQRVTCEKGEVLDVCPVLSRQGNSCRLQIKATGEFVVHKEDKVITSDYYGRAWVVGFWPGVKTFTDRPPSERNLSAIATAIIVPLGSLGVNGVYLGIPTLNALLIEPFKEYRPTPNRDAFAADWSIIGCRKHVIPYKGEEKFVHVASENVKQTDLTDFTLTVNGRSYNVSNGYATIEGLCSGDNVSIKIDTPPTLLIPTNDRYENLVGIDFELRCP